MRIYLQLPSIDGKEPKFCHLHLQEDLIQGWNFIREQGNQGRSGKITRQHFDSHDDALDALMKAKDNAISRGFKMVFAEGDR